MEIKRPVVFVSSTIYDFKDLRSSIKYYLEELGYEVLLSEYNDFPKSLDQNMYDACLSTLEKADYYLLLLGSRVGGYYDLKNKISITQMEYRKAYEMTQAGKLKCVFFVRDDLWKIKDDRKALRDYLVENYAEEHELSLHDREKIINHPSSFVNDTDFIFRFINEVARQDEMQSATEKGTLFPEANWIHTFTTFRDVVDVLRTNLNVSEDLSIVALKINLERELKENLAILSEKHESQISPSYLWASFARRCITGDMNSESKMPGRYLKWALMFSTTGVPVHGLSTQFVDQSLESGYFLEYDKDTGSFTQTLISERISQLKQRMNHLQVMSQGSQQLLAQFAMKYREVAKTEHDVLIPNEDLLIPLAIADTQEDIFILSIAILEALAGNSALLGVVKLNASSPFLPEAQKIEQETATIADITYWIDKQLGKNPEGDFS